MHKSQGGIGFKDLSAFNLAILGKQARKFLSESQSFVSRIFKARYFPSKSFLDASIGRNPSYVWRSILRSLFIVHGGARWSIGSGATIPILHAPWLANGESIDGNIAGGLYVRDFNVQSLLSEHIIHDRLIWKAESNGCYSVRSAYNICVEELIDVSHLRRPEIEDKNMIPPSQKLGMARATSHTDVPTPRISFVVFCFMDKLPVSLFLT
ncbi:hypothetical protein MTR_7g451250 [Medicago truncatula]|uniref:Uncharacterized protein n=1 Tax=Medicago truncatula TaxID=3880 RepID=A0A072U034_MEDTR|nr:hypothetical protein MTR_7g451250 [Medicago truncatula]